MLNKLFQAIKVNDMTRIKKMLTNYPQLISMVDEPTGMTAFHAAIVANKDSKAELIKYLLSKGADPNTSDHNGRSVLYFAVVSESLECVDFILTIVPLKELINKPDREGYTLLHEAAAQGNVKIIARLISLGADLRIKNNDGFSAIDDAITNNHLDAVLFLYEKGQRPFENQNYLCGLHLIADFGHTQILNYFIEKEVILTTNKQCDTPLMYAALKGNVDCLNSMLTHSKARYADNRNGDIKTLSKFEFINLGNNNGTTALHLAAKNGQVASLECLMRHGALCLQNQQGLSPLHYAAQKGHENALTFLIETEINLFILHKNNGTPLHEAAFNGHFSSLSCLLNHPNAKYIDDRKSDKKILTKKEYIDFRSTSGNTALHGAAQCGQIDAINLLISLGADIESKNNNGETPLDLAKAGHHKKAVDFINHHQLNRVRKEQPNADEKSKNTHSSNNPFFILGLGKEASGENIRRAYHKKMREYHPDKRNQNNVEMNEMAGIISWAYKILIDPNERKKWEAFEAENNSETYYQVSTSGERPSELYRFSFEKLNNFFQISPLELLLKEKKKQAFDKLNNLFHNKLFGEGRYQYLYGIKDENFEHSDIYEYIRHLSKQSTQLTPLNLQEKLNPAIVINLLLRFLAGEFYGINLTAVQNYLKIQITQLRRENNPFISFYRPIQTIINVTSMKKEYQAILDAIAEIYSFTYQPSNNHVDIVSLMQDKYFRYLVAKAHCYFWQDDLPRVNKIFLSSMKSNLSSLYVLPWGKTLLRIENTLLKAFSDEENVEAIYDCAYLLIDLSESYLTYASVINSSILAGLCFQYAAQKEIQPSKAMAAQHIALCLYQKAMKCVFYARAQIALYASTHIAKFVSELAYDQSTLDKNNYLELLFQPGDASIAVQAGTVIETIEGALQKALYYLDILPIYTGPTATFDLEIIGMFQLELFRTLLQSFMNQQSLSSDQDPTKIVYELYQNAIDKYCDSEVEKKERLEEIIKFKLLTIQYLLEKDNSNSEEMEKLIDQPYIHMQRDVEGFFQINSELYFFNDENIKIYKSFDGFEINEFAINLFVTEWQEGDPRSLRLFTDHDLAQMIILGIMNGALSLDHTDRNKLFNPLQMVRYAPSCILDTEYLKTLFMVDYILKMIIVGAEVSADSPYLAREVSPLLACLPEPLCRVFTKYRENHQLHNTRVWLATETIERQEIRTDQSIKIHYGNVHMVVKAHPLDLDTQGELVDSAIDSDHELQDITNNLDELGQYFPEFSRLKQLVKVSGAVTELIQIREQNKLNMQGSSTRLKKSNIEENKIFAKQNALEGEFKAMQLADHPKNEPLAPTTLRAPSIFYEFRDGMTERLHHIIGGVLAFPTFKKVDSSSKLFKSSGQNRVIRAKELTSNYSKNTNTNTKINHHPTPKNKNPEPTRSNPCSISAFIKAALNGGRKNVDTLGIYDTSNPVNDSYIPEDKEASRMNTNPVKMGWLAGVGMGLFNQWKACKESKKKEASVATQQSKPKSNEQFFQGYGGAQCTIHDILVATNAVNNLDEKHGVGSQIINGFRGDIRWECASEHIQQSPK